MLIEKYDLSLIGEVLKQLRKDKGMTRDDLGAAIGHGKDLVKKVENGTYKSLTEKLLKKFCKALDTSFDGIEYYILLGQLCVLAEDFLGLDYEGTLFMFHQRLAGFGDGVSYVVAPVVDAWSMPVSDEMKLRVFTLGDMIAELDAYADSLVCEDEVEDDDDEIGEEVVDEEFIEEEDEE